MRTFKDLLEVLPEEAREPALRNAEAQRGEYTHQMEDESCEQVLLGAFVWGGTPEGSDYWHKIHKDLLDRGL